MDTALDRAALYYPRIHIRDVQWLKQTLLCFPQVRRMIPMGYPLNDRPGIREIRDLVGPRGEPLLYEEDVYGYEVYQAQARLAEKLKAEPEERLQQFTQASTYRRYGSSGDGYQIHRGKLMDVLSFLEDRGMAWAPRAEGRRGDWVALHPDLAAAIMSFIAIAIADAKGLDIVTESIHAHLAVSTHDEESVFEELMRGRRPPHSHARIGVSDGVDELVQVVMRTCFDVSRLTPQQVADLVNDGKDLRAFKDALVPLARSIPAISDANERKKRFDAAASEVVAMWQAYKKSLPRFALDAIVNTADIDPPDLLGTAVGGIGVHHFMGIGGALFFGFFTYAGIGVVREWRQRVNSPMKYLTRIQKAGAVLVKTQ